MSLERTIETDSRSISMAVVNAVAAIDDTPPTELTPLGNVVDPEALDDLFAGKASLGKAVFNYNSYEISVDGDGDVAVEDHS